jgi:hypothetical protein
MLELARMPDVGWIYQEGPMRVLLAIFFGLIATAADAGSCQYIAGRITATTAFRVNVLEVSRIGTTASRRGTPEITHTTATARAHSGLAITPTTMTGRHPSGTAIIPILATASDASGSSIKCIATKLVDLLRLDRSPCSSVEVMGLLGRLAPDHKTIADFRKDNGLALRRVCEPRSDASTSRDGRTPIRYDEGPHGSDTLPD